MIGTAQKLIYVGLTLMLVTAAWGLEYVWVTNRDLDPFGFPIRFTTGDTLWGRVHSNYQIAISGSPVFYDLVTSTADDFWRGSGYNPQFLGPPPQFRVRSVPFPNLTLVRMAAAAQGTIFDPGPRRSMLAFIAGDELRICEWMTGAPVDSSRWTAIWIGPNAHIFFNCPLRIWGVLEGELTIGCSQDVRIENDIRYVDSHWETGVTPATSTNYFALGSERDIKIANNPANGRENSNGGSDRHDSSHVVLCGSYYALGGSFTFENQNDGGDSGYVCDCSPDERGTLFLFGGIAQMERGYLHRSTQGGTGYRLHLQNDPRLYFHGDNIWYTAPQHFDIPDSIHFGEVVERTIATQTLALLTTQYYGGYATYPFQTRQHVQRGDSVFIPVEFTPPRPGYYSGTLSIYVSQNTYTITLNGTGVTNTASAPGLTSSPTQH